MPAKQNPPEDDWQNAELHPAVEFIDFHGIDCFPLGTRHVYINELWNLLHRDLEYGLPGIPDETHDLVICEQVLEHLAAPGQLLGEMMRVLKPGGTPILGVPIFPSGLNLVRKHVIPVTDRLFHLRKVRGFRFTSGGVLRFLEYHAWWWKTNRWLGTVLPFLCVEIQLYGIKAGEISTQSPGSAGSQSKKIRPA